MAAASQENSRISDHRTKSSSKKESGVQAKPEETPDLERPVGTSLSNKIAGLSLSTEPTNNERMESSHGTVPKPTPKPMLNPLAKNFIHGSPVKIVSNEDPKTPKPLTTPKNKTAVKPMPNPFSQSVSAEPFSPKMFGGSGGGKFANSATTEADVGESDAGTRAVPGNFHRKPRFKQVIPKSKPADHSNGASLTTNPKLVSLLDYASEDTEHERDDDNDQDDAVHLKIEGLLPRLLPHQERGVRFMARRERGRKYVRGGLLADDMGLGKTIQSIALILYHPPETPDAPKTTLVVTPLAVMDQWKDEIQQMAPKLRVGTHQGTSRTKDASHFDRFDVLVTTYDVVSREHEAEGPLFCRAWHRVIADEAHSFRGPKTKACAAMAALKSDGRRWALTGTPLHNKLLDLYPLFKFIGVPQSTSVTQFEAAYTSDEGLETLKKQLRAIMLRRTQKVLRSFLPSLKTHPTRTQLSPAELTLYESWVPQRSKSDLSSVKVVALTRMRQACDGLLNTKGKIELGWSDDNLNPGDVKPIEAHDSPDSPSDDLKTSMVNETQDLADMLDMLSIKPKADEERMYVGHGNSKIEEVRRILSKDRKRKTIIFSSFVTMLVALQPMLDFEGIKYLQYDGSLNADKRRQMLAQFRDERSGVIVLLCSLQTASVGLNLTSASQVIMVDPWWNPQIVDQAIKRVHRLGQVREVDCHLLFAGGTLDERMMHIQDVKRQLAINLIDGSAELTAADKSFLYFGTDPKDDANAIETADQAESESTQHITEYSKKTIRKDKHRLNGAASRSQDSTASDNEDSTEPFVKVDLPWNSQRKLPSIPKHKKFTS